MQFIVTASNQTKVPNCLVGVGNKDIIEIHAQYIEIDVLKFIVKLFMKLIFYPNICG
jgi:hypothetical protein